MEEQDSANDQVTTSRRLVYFAAERTLMAWVRSALGLMALGFVIDRFGLVLRQIAPQVGAEHYSKAFSFWAGTILVVVGAVMALVAALRYWRFAHHYRHEGDTRPGHGIMLGVVFTALISVLGFVVALFLLNFSD